MKKLRYVILTLVLALSGWTSTAAMIFKSPDNQMWDMWCYHDKGTWYLYFLSASKGEQYDGFSVATSPDGVHWNFAGTPVRMSDKVNGGLGNTGLGTGHTWKSPHYAQDGKFFSDFTVNGTSKSPSSYIRFVESRDLLHWQHLDIEFRPDPRWYKEDYRWDCIKAMARAGGGYYGYWTAAPKERLGFGFGETDDGMHWRALPPPLLDWAGHPVPQEVEVGGVEKIGQKYFALLTAFTRSKGTTVWSPSPPTTRRGLSAPRQKILKCCPACRTVGFLDSSPALTVCWCRISRCSAFPIAASWPFTRRH